MLLQTSQRQRGECGTFSGGRKTFRGECGTFLWGHKTFREVCGTFLWGHKTFRGLCGKLSGGHKTFRGLCGAFTGVPETSADSAAHLRGSRKSARTLRRIYGGPGNQRGVCGKPIKHSFFVLLFSRLALLWIS